MNRKIVYITGTRAEYGLMKTVLTEIQRDPNLSLELLVTGMHLMEEFGLTIREIEADGFSHHRIDAVYDNSEESVIKFLGKFFLLSQKKIIKINPDIILVAGDRAEMLAGAIVGSYLSIPVAHISGGDVTSTVDEHVRHAITKLANIHFAYTRKSANRIYRMGEDRWRIHITGAPGLDAILKEPLIAPENLSDKYGLDLNKPVILMIQHPVTLEAEQAGSQIQKTLDALVELAYQTLVIYPNADHGSRDMVAMIRKYEKYHFIKAYKSIPRNEYLSLLNICSALVGNSSSGIIESASFHIPVINIGSRQDGRERADNVLDVDYDTYAIRDQICRAINDMAFRAKVKQCVNPYGNGTASEKIVHVLKGVVLDNAFLQKKLRY